MTITLTINGIRLELDCQPQDSLRAVLAGMTSIAEINSAPMTRIDTMTVTDSATMKHASSRSTRCASACVPWSAMDS